MAINIVGGLVIGVMQLVRVGGMELTGGGFLTAKTSQVFGVNRRAGHAFNVTQGGGAQAIGELVVVECHGGSRVAGRSLVLLLHLVSQIGVVIVLRPLRVVRIASCARRAVGMIMPPAAVIGAFHSL